MIFLVEGKKEGVRDRNVGKRQTSRLYFYDVLINDSIALLSIASET